MERINFTICYSDMQKYKSSGIIKQMDDCPLKLIVELLLIFRFEFQF